MCRPASMIVTSGHKMTWSKTNDSHSDIRREFGMPENPVGRVTSVQVEIVPLNEDYALPLKNWKFVVDQDTLPDWWDAVEAEKQCRISLEDWAKVRLVRHGENREIKDARVFALAGSQVTACGNSQVTARENCTVNMWHAFACKICGIGAVIIDRTGAKARCIVGTEKERIVKSK